MADQSSTVNVPPGFVKLLESGEFVLFLGAGVGVEAGFANWRTTLIQLADALEPYHKGFADLMKGEANADRYLESAELFYLAPLTPTTRHNLLGSVLSREPIITRRLKLLTQTRCQGIVTTNFDRSLPVAASEARSHLVIFGEADADLAAARVIAKPFLARIHGRAEVPESLTFAVRHYRGLSERAQYVEFFRELFLQRNLVFFGFSFADPVIANLIRDMSTAVRSVFRREAYALVSEPVDARLIEALREASIVPVPYDPKDQHQAAWELLADYRTGPTPITAELHESAQVRSHLAAAYARAKGKEFSADRDRLLSALMTPVLSEFGANAVVDLEEFLNRVEQRLALPRSFERVHLMEAVKILEREGAVALQGATLLVGDLRPATELAHDANRLVDGIVGRAAVKLNEAGLADQRAALEQVVITALSLDGLHLAHTLIRGNPMDGDRLEKVISDAIEIVGVPARWRGAASQSVRDLFIQPDAEEEQILTNISAVVFGTALLLADPLMADKAADPFERGAYVDASVLLPWIADGHPLRDAYDSLLRSFELSRVRVLSGYLNEIMSHRRLAIEAVDRGGFGDVGRFKRYASLFELHNINVFLGGYAGRLERGDTDSFADYLQRVAPFESEEQLRRHLESLGIVVEEHPLKDRAISGELKGVLKDAGKYREDVVIAHDAAQLEVLRSITEARARQYFVTADRALVRAIPKTSSKFLISHVLLPQQVAFLAQMADRRTTGLQAFSRTLWTVGASTAERVRQYYSDRVLREYEEGLAADLDKILDAIMRDLKSDGFEPDDDAARDPKTESGRLKLFERLDRFEPKFFQYMAEAKDRVAKRLNG